MQLTLAYQQTKASHFFLNKKINCQSGRSKLPQNTKSLRRVKPVHHFIRPLHVCIVGWAKGRISNL